MVYAELKKIQRKLGKDVFPLIPQTLYANRHIDAPTHPPIHPPTHPPTHPVLTEPVEQVPELS